MISDERRERLYEQARALDGRVLKDFPKDLLLEVSTADPIDPESERCAEVLCNRLWSAYGRDGLGISRCWMFAIDCGQALDGDREAEPEAVYEAARDSHQWLNGFSVAGLMSARLRRVCAAIDGEEGPETTKFEVDLRDGLRSRAECGPWFAHNGRRYAFFTCNYS